MSKNNRYKPDVTFITRNEQESDEALYLKAVIFFGGIFLIPAIIISLLIEFSNIWFQELALFIPLITTVIGKQTRKKLTAWKKAGVISLIEGVLLLITPSITFYSFEIPWWQEVIDINRLYLIGIINTIGMGITIVKNKSKIIS